MEGYCSTGQSPQWAVVPVEEEEEEEEGSIYSHAPHNDVSVNDGRLYEGGPIRS
jgi:hypothetical protein